jgi:hypothetical protein
MGLHYDLPVYKACYDLLLEIFQFTKDFGKEYKYTVGEELKNETLVLIVLVFWANKQYLIERKQIITLGNMPLKHNKTSCYGFRLRLDLCCV